MSKKRKTPRPHPDHRYPLDEEGYRILPAKHDTSLAKSRLSVRDRSYLGKKVRDQRDQDNWEEFVHREKVIKAWVARYGCGWPVNPGFPEKYKSSGLQKRPGWASSNWDRHTIGEMLWTIGPLEPWEMELQRRETRDEDERRKYGNTLLEVREELERHLMKRPNPRALSDDEYKKAHREWTRRRHLLHLIAVERLPASKGKHLVRRVSPERLEVRYPSLLEKELHYSGSKLRELVRDRVFKHRLSLVEQALARRGHLDQSTEDITSMRDLDTAERSLGLTTPSGVEDRVRKVYFHMKNLGGSHDEIARHLSEDGLIFTETWLRGHDFAHARPDKRVVLVDTDLDDEPDDEETMPEDFSADADDDEDFMFQVFEDLEEADRGPRRPTSRLAKYIASAKALDQLGRNTTITSRVKGLAGVNLQFSELRDLGRLDEIEARLLAKYPYASEVIGVITSQLRENFMSGKAEIHIRPIIVVGEPGCGKTSLLRDLSAELEVPSRKLSVGGMRDGNLFGTSAGWSTAMPSIMTTAISEDLRINPLMVLDEIDKAHTSQNGSVHQELLSLLEPDEARSYFDKGLRTHVDASHISWAFTANRLDPIPSHLLSRCIVVEMPQPQAQHVCQIARQILSDYAEGRGLDPRFFRLTSADIQWLEESFDRHRSARILRELVLRSIEDPSMHGPAN